jgi:gluconolactonase
MSYSYIHSSNRFPLLFPTAALLLLAACSCSGPKNAASSAVKESFPTVGSILRLDPALDALVPPDAKIEKIGSGFKFTEGPLPFSNGNIWFSDVVGNVVRQWSPDGAITEILRPGGADNPDYAPAGSFIGPNGMVFDKDGSVLLCQHGNRRIVRIDKDRHVSLLVDRWNGKRFNSPNDLVFKSDGALYITDPPYGLVKQDDDPTKEIKFNGVFRYADGKVTPVIRDLTRPNGIAFSPDEKYLYISNSDEKHKVWMRYEVQPDGSVANGKLIFDATAEPAAGNPDGMKIDARGNVYSAGPGGLWIFSPEGKHLGTIKPGETPANCNWGGPDHKTLFITAETGLYRIRLSVEGEKAIYHD